MCKLQKNIQSSNLSQTKVIKVPESPEYKKDFKKQQRIWKFSQVQASKISTKEEKHSKQPRETLKDKKEVEKLRQANLQK